MSVALRSRRTSMTTVGRLPRRAYRASRSLWLVGPSSNQVRVVWVGEVMSMSLGLAVCGGVARGAPAIRCCPGDHVRSQMVRAAAVAVPR